MQERAMGQWLVGQRVKMDIRSRAARVVLLASSHGVVWDVRDRLDGVGRPTWELVWGEQWERGGAAFESLGHYGADWIG